MRIVHVSDFYPPRVGGVEQQVFQLAHAQAAAGHEVHVVTATTTATTSTTSATTSAETVTVHRLPADGRRRTGILAGPSALRAVGRAVTSLKPEVVHAHSSVLSPFALVGAAAASDAGVPTVVTVHSMWATLSTPYRTIFRRVGLSPRPIRWTAVSEIAAAQVRLALGPGHDVSVLPNGIDPGAWLPPEGIASDGAVHIVALLRFAPRKRPLALLGALRRARRQVPADIPLRATLAGAGPLRAVGTIYTRVFGMTWVDLPGSLTPLQVRELLRSASLFVSAARLESFGIAALEARCSGVPVVAIGGTGIEDFVADGVEGLIAADDRALATAIASLAEEAGARKAIADHVRGVRPAFSWPVTLAAADRAYEQAARALSGDRSARS